MRQTVLHTRNITRGLRLLDLLTPGSQPFGVIWGSAGRGKTSLAKLILNGTNDAVYLRARVTWQSARGMMLSDLLSAVDPHYGVGWHSQQFLYRELLDLLRDRPDLMLLVDEADYLVRGRHFTLLDTLRDVADEARIRVMFFSIASLAHLLKGATGFLEAFASRVADTVEFTAVSLPEATKLAAELIEGVSLDRDLIAHCHQESNGSLRVLLGLFQVIEVRARTAKVTNVSLADAVNLGLVKRPRSAKAPINSANFQPPLRAIVG